MSWIFGCLSENLSEEDSLNFQSIHDKCFTSFGTQKLYLCIGGNKLTGFSSKDSPNFNNGLKGWAVSGVGLLADENSQKIMSSNDWNVKLKDYKFDPSSINGHFIVITWENDSRLKIYNDIVGFKTIYLLNQNKRTIFSTELSWITRLMNSPTIDLSSLGSRWLTFNQLSHNCIIKGVEKLPPAGKAELTSNKIVAQNENWIPQKIESTSESFTRSLVPFLFPKSNDNYPISLGLSGGLDSRTLLSLAFSDKSKKHNENVILHSFGSDSDQDCLVAGEICKKIKNEHTLLTKNTIFDEKFTSELSEYSKDALLVEPVSSIVKNIYFDDEYFRNKIIIDGANGEIARRQFYNRLLLKGWLDLKPRNAKNILTHLTINRSDIFNSEVMEEMEDGCLKDVKNLFEVLPSIERIGRGKFVDLIAIKFRFPNYFGPEQNRLNKRIISYMPFSQVSVIEQAFNLPSSIKRNSRLFYNLISENKPILKEFPLVKNGITYPYGLSTLSAFIYTNLKKRITPPKVINPAYLFYQGLKEYINELVLSAEVRNFAFYDHRKLTKVVDLYYNGDNSVQHQLDWWFTFELWRRSHHL